MFPNRIVTHGSALLRNNVRSFATETPIPASPYKLFKLSEGPCDHTCITKDEAFKLYSQMCTIRRTENALAALYRQKLIRGFCHLYDGQEAVATGIRSVMSPNDNIITAYRCHGWSYLMGIPLEGIVCELLGRQHGCSKGKGGSMHMYGSQFYGGNGIVGGHVPVGTGLALAHKYNNTGGVAIICYGDGAANQGQVFESFNMAKLWMLPCLYVCENNRYGMGTSTTRAAANTEYFSRGDYIPGVYVDGMDIVAVREATHFCKDFIQKGNGPIIMEALTYRYHGHSMSDPGISYRSREEVKSVKESSDPLKTFKRKCVKSGLCTEEEMVTVDTAAKSNVEAAVAFAMNDKEPPLEWLTYDVYSNNLEGNIRTCIYDRPTIHRVTGAAVNIK